MVFAHYTTMVRRLKTAEDWRNDETMAGGDAFFEEGIHWLHLANSLGPVHHERSGVSGPGRPGPGRTAAPRACWWRFATTTTPSARLFYSREVPSLLRGLRVSKLIGREGIISFESNGVVVLVRGSAASRAWSSPGSETCVAIAQCIAISWVPSESTARPR